jgi:four helix bundle protein
MTTLATYRDLIAWQKAIDFAVEAHKLTRKLPESERFGLTAQLRRAAVSVPSNIAEGAGRSHTGDYRRHPFHRARLAGRV